MYPEEKKTRMYTQEKTHTRALSYFWFTSYNCHLYFADKLVLGEIIECQLAIKSTVYMITMAKAKARM